MYEDLVPEAEPEAAGGGDGGGTGQQPGELSAADRKLLEYNRRIHEVNGAPLDFPSFIREGYNVRVLTEGGYADLGEGLLVKDYFVGAGPAPEDGQEVVRPLAFLLRPDSRLEVRPRLPVIPRPDLRRE